MASNLEVAPDGGAREIGANVVIIGAGVAGLVTASRLYEHGFTNVTILEARDRPGGRTYSKPFDGSYIEHGAQWIHGQEGNAVYQVAKANDLVDEECTSFLEHFYVWPQLTKEESCIASEVSSVVTEALDKCLKISLSGVRDVSSSVVQKSVGHFLRHKLLDYIQANHFPESKVKLIEACYDWAVRLQHEIQGCSSLTDLSALFFGNYHECDGNIVTELKYGYGRFVEVIMRSIPPEWLHLNKKVTNINTSLATLSSSNFHPIKKSLSHLKTSFAAVPLRSNKPLITVVCEDGTTLKADHVVVTLPLGVLKANASSMFDPPLPEKKLLAIRSLGYGTVDKVFLKYDNPFWQPTDVYQVLWLDGFNHCGNKVDQDDMSAWVTHGQLQTSWFRYIGRFNAVRHQPQVLCCWLSGEGAKFMETLSDDEVRTGCHQVLRQVLGRPDLPEPNYMERSTWHSDPFSVGSYSYIAVSCDTTGSLPLDLAEPVCEPVVHFGTEVMYPLLLFAGEATHSSFFSTVHGAYESGIREADRLADFYLDPVEGMKKRDA